MSTEEKLKTTDLRDAIVEMILEKKGEDIAVIDLNGVTTMSDYFIIATGNSNVHVKAIADGINIQLKNEHKALPWHVEGMGSQKWILLDYVDIVVHIFDEKMRKFYALEKLWEDAKIVHIKDELTS